MVLKAPRAVGGNLRQRGAFLCVRPFKITFMSSLKNYNVHALFIGQLHKNVPARKTVFPKIAVAGVNPKKSRIFNPQLSLITD
jgi:hypothetical protein